MQAGVESGATILYFDLNFEPANHAIKHLSLSFNVTGNWMSSSHRPRQRLFMGPEPSAANSPTVRSGQDEQRKHPPSYNELVRISPRSGGTQLSTNRRRPPITYEVLSPWYLDRPKLGGPDSRSITWTLKARRTYDSTSGNPTHVTWTWDNPAGWTFPNGRKFRLAFIVVHDYADFTVQASMTDKPQGYRRSWWQKHDDPCLTWRLQFQPTVSPVSVSSAVEELRTKHLN